MSKLLEVASEHTGDSAWTAGLTVETLQSSLYRAVAGLCLPAPVGSGPLEGEPTGFPLSPFAVIVQMRRSALCRTSEPADVVAAAVEAEKERSAGRALWYGTGNASLWFGGRGATTVAAGAGIGEALQAFYDKTIGVEPIVHLGLVAAATLQTQFNNEGRFLAFPDVPVVVNPGYPASGLAVSGPVEVWFGSVENTQNLATSNNRLNTEATVLGAVAVDPDTVVVRDKLPDQVYVGINGKDVSVYVVESSANATVDWDDAAADTTITAGSNVPALHTYTSGTYNLTVTSNSGVATYRIVV